MKLRLFSFSLILLSCTFMRTAKLCESDALVLEESGGFAGTTSIWNIRGNGNIYQTVNYEKTDPIFKTISSKNTDRIFKNTQIAFEKPACDVHTAGNLNRQITLKYHGETKSFQWAVGTGCAADWDKLYGEILETLQAGK